MTGSAWEQGWSLWEIDAAGERYWVAARSAEEARDCCLQTWGPRCEQDLGPVQVVGQVTDLDAVRFRDSEQGRRVTGREVVRSWLADGLRLPALVASTEGE